MKRMMPLVLATLTLGATLLAESPTWAEQLHKTKTGAWPAGVEKRLQQEKVAREQARQQQAVANALAKLDANGDGVVSKTERESVTKAENTAPGAQR
jgi:hypothetical protein